MNIQNILLLADFIENEKDFPFDNCGTASCIYGFGAALWGVIDNLSKTVAKKLDISADQMEMLFFPGDSDLDPEICPKYNSITRADAVWTLRNLAETGEVKWSPKP